MQLYLWNDIWNQEGNEKKLKVFEKYLNFFSNANTIQFIISNAITFQKYLICILMQCMKFAFHLMFDIGLTLFIRSYRLNVTQEKVWQTCEM